MVQIIAAIKRSTKTANIESPPFYCQRLFILERNLHRLAEIVKLEEELSLIKFTCKASIIFSEVHFYHPVTTTIEFNSSKLCCLVIKIPDWDLPKT